MRHNLVTVVPDPDLGLVPPARFQLERFAPQHLFSCILCEVKENQISVHCALAISQESP